MQLQEKVQTANMCGLCRRTALTMGRGETWKAKHRLRRHRNWSTAWSAPWPWYAKSIIMLVEATALIPWCAQHQDGQPQAKRARTDQCFTPPAASYGNTTPLAQRRHSLGSARSSASPISAAMRRPVRNVSHLASPLSPTRPSHTQVRALDQAVADTHLHASALPSTGSLRLTRYLGRRTSSTTLVYQPHPQHQT